MTELRKRMIECLQLQGYSERTQEAYVRAVRQLADHYHKPPDQITEEELRQYFLYIKTVKKYSRAALDVVDVIRPVTGKYHQIRSLSGRYGNARRESVKSPVQRRLRAPMSSVSGALRSATVQRCAIPDI